MKNYLPKFFIINVMLTMFVVTILMGKENKSITGTVGKEHMVGKQLVICELGTQACMFLDIDPDLQIKVDGKTYEPQELQVGWYIQAEVEIKHNLAQVITRLTVDTNKTIICFSSLNEQQTKTLQNILQKTNGIKLVKTYLESKQLYIEYNPKTISYPEIENRIVREGFNIE
jgi:hypothetical protein